MIKCLMSTLMVIDAKTSSENGVCSKTVFNPELIAELTIELWEISQCRQILGEIEKKNRERECKAIIKGLLNELAKLLVKFLEQ